MKNGFTLIELLLVVVIIGIIAALVLPKFGGVKEKAYVAAMKNDLRNMATAQEIFFDDNGAYAASVGELGATTSKDVSVDFVASDAAYTATATHGKTDVGCTLSVGASAGQKIECEALSPYVADPASTIFDLQGVTSVKVASDALWGAPSRFQVDIDDWSGVEMVLTEINDGESAFAAVVDGAQTIEFSDWGITIVTDGSFVAAASPSSVGHIDVVMR